MTDVVTLYTDTHGIWMQILAVVVIVGASVAVLGFVAVILQTVFQALRDQYDDRRLRARYRQREQRIADEALRFLDRRTAAAEDQRRRLDVIVKGRPQ